MEFDNGEKYSYSAEFLRVHSPAANSSRKSASGEVKVSKSWFSLSLQIQMPLSNSPNGFFADNEPLLFLTVCVFNIGAGLFQGGDMLQLCELNQLGTMASG